MGRSDHRGTIGASTDRTNKGRVIAIRTDSVAWTRRSRGLPTRLSRVGLLFVLILITACGAQGTKVTNPGPTPPDLQPIPTPTEFPVGSGQPAPLRDSLALVRQAGSDQVSGAALVITSDGFLVTIDENLGKRPEIVLPNGQVASPIRVASDSSSGLTLLKVSADRLVPVRLGLEQIDPGNQIFAEGFDATTASYGQVAGKTVTPVG